VPDLTLTPDYISRLIVKVRAVQGREGTVDIDSGSNPTDDNMVDMLQENPGDLSREELRQEIRGLGELSQAELVALLWTGRGDVEPEEWEATVRQAAERREMPTERYLLMQPLLAEYWAEGLEKLGIELPVSEPGL
jgi:hypothetical protein